MINDSSNNSGETIDNLHNRLVFDLVNKNQIPAKNLLKGVKFQNLFKNVVCGKHSFKIFTNFLITMLPAEIVTTFSSKMVTISACM